MWRKFIELFSRKFKTNTMQEVVDFLIDVNIALGNDYDQPGRHLFSQFSPFFNDDPYLGLTLSTRLAQAYTLLGRQDKAFARLIVRKALEQCAGTPLGLKRSLTCLDLAHEIEPALVTEQIFSDLMFRPEHKEDLAILLLQLVYRWEQWNIKVKLNSGNWVRAIQEIEPSGVFSLLLYFFNNINDDNDEIECFNKLCSIAIERISVEKNIFSEIGQEPRIIKREIEKLQNIFRTRLIKQSSTIDDTTKKGNVSFLNNLRLAR